MNDIKYISREFLRKSNTDMNTRMVILKYLHMSQMFELGVASEVHSLKSKLSISEMRVMKYKYDVELKQSASDMLSEYPNPEELDMSEKTYYNKCASTSNKHTINYYKDNYNKLLDVSINGSDSEYI